MGFATALSGLKAASTSLQVTGNNIANSQTTGFKESRAEFADVYASSIGGVAKTQPGSGVKVTEVAQQFNQGNIEATQNSLDLAVSGNGFFVLADRVNLPDKNNPNAPVDPSIPNAYTRNGAFQLNSVGNVVNDKGQYLLAFAPNGTTIAEGFSTGVFRPMTIDTSQGLPTSTENINMKLNINGAALVPTATPFTPSDPLSYNNTTSITTYDVQGNAHIASTYYVKTGANTWDAYLFLDNYGITSGGQAVSPNPAPASTVVGLNVAGDPIKLEFNASGLLQQVSSGSATAAPAAAAAETAINAIAIAAADAQAVVDDITASAADDAAAIADGEQAIIDNAAAIPALTVDEQRDAVLAAITGVSDPAGAVTAAATAAAGVAGATAANVLAAAQAAAATNTAAIAAATAAVAADPTDLAATQAAVAAAVAPAATSATKVDFGAIDLSDINPNLQVDPMAFDIDFFGTTQFSTPFSVNGLDQDGLPAGNLTGIDVDSTGAVFARYSNGGSKVLGQVALARFPSNQSLAKLGDTSWAATSTSGAPIYGAAGDNNFGTIQSSALEGSNVDLSDQLVKLIIAQQAYQANSQTITTEKTLIETILRA
ncbi:MAG: flagellar hook protein FlgE [Methylobacter sp.]|jgi:flagellar hook protein FlgE|nr:flagellar hook protein FlgE [Methylobacter sp.]